MKPDSSCAADEGSSDGAETVQLTDGRRPETEQST
jgi:hypothetical protein